MMLLTLLLASGCAWRRAPVVDARAVALTTADAQFAARAGPADVDAAVEVWSAILARDPSDGEVLARLAHAEWVRAQLSVPGEALGHFEVGEEYGWRCLVGIAAFDAARRAHGGRVSDEVVAAVGAERAPCLVWTAVHAVERVGLRGGGATLALEEARVLLARARELGAEPSPWSPVPGLVDWAEARVGWASARGDVEESAARRALVAVADRHPGVAHWACDARRAGEEREAPEQDRTPEGEALRGRWAACRAADDGSAGDEP